MLPPEDLIREIQTLEDHFAERLAAHAGKEELSTLFIHIKSLKEQLGITCHSQLTQPHDYLPISTTVA